ncbi:ribosomal protein L1 [Aulographum hederae CBS 113979]|uniref:Ribosomal protein L1 n=1 Tax=Aulographum hederae CBS 113979 TaxID=1176131 RepID=A0A6G1HH15_9PEZI|nr:ribosomal protein L1 [Aulographum hederae CBS 113979]
MAPAEITSTTVARKYKPAPSQLDPDQVHQAAKSLVKHLSSTVSENKLASGKKSLLADSDDTTSTSDDTPIWVVFTSKHYFAEKRTPKARTISLPHSFRTSPTLRICLITTDPQRMYKDLVESPSFPSDVSKRISRVISIGKLQAKYKTYEARRQLKEEHDIFLADDRLYFKLVTVLGNVFFQNGGQKRPIPVSLMGTKKREIERDSLGMPIKKKLPDGTRGSELVGEPKDVAAAIEKALHSTLVHLSPSVSTAIKAGEASFPPERLAENIKAVVDTMVEKYLPQKWSLVRSIHIKGPETTALPIWMAEELWVDDSSVLENGFKAIEQTEEQKLAEKEARSWEKKWGSKLLGDAARELLDDEEVKEIEDQQKSKKRKANRSADKVVTKKAKKEEANIDLAKEIADRKAKLKKMKRDAIEDADEVAPKKKSKVAEVEPVDEVKTKKKSKKDKAA